LLAALAPHLQLGPKPKWRRGIALPSVGAVGVFRRALYVASVLGCFEQILPEDQEALSPADDPLEQAQLRWLGLWKAKQLVSRRR